MSRRRPTNTVKVLTSSDLAERYNVLIEKRSAVADFHLKKMQEEHALQVELLNLEIELKKQELARQTNTQ